ncbi:autotransporter domain-containing protein [Oxalobacter aliiformigenes]|uniref:autotransporter domain-containing protein n=1 Tax=Oxalobacter aliiformigenes TaxID=2946593 RepID=UPI0022AF4286|nr:autotransporter domain-containing protein [Oxalobacter aliiformigenes]MCZ4065906.1 autotransporter domain-containing protein [Oxalobacter aliiformigenes]WAW00231.1 autotransporter domain-containing protein [Oxalobacter aliiformigenes]
MSKKKFFSYPYSPLCLALATFFSGMYCTSGMASAATIHEVSSWKDIKSHSTENDVLLNVRTDLEGSYFESDTSEIVIDQVKMTIDGQKHNATFPKGTIDDILMVKNNGNLTVRNFGSYELSDEGNVISATGGFAGSDSTASYMFYADTGGSLTLDNVVIQNITDSLHPGRVMIILENSKGAIHNSVIRNSSNSFGYPIIYVNSKTTEIAAANTDALLVSNSHFINNSGVGYGGVIAASPEGGKLARTLAIRQSRFAGNRVNPSSGGYAYGGAIFVWATNADIEKSVFTKNVAQSDKEKASALGGAIYNIKGTLSLKDSVFSGNTVSSPYTAYGGAIYNAGELLIHNGTFQQNTARNATYSRGGAIYNRKDGMLSLSGTNTFTENTAGDKPNDITNYGTLNFGAAGNEHEKNLIGSGIDGNGELNLNSGILEIAENRTVEQGKAAFADDTETRVTVNDKHVVKAAHAASATDIEDVAIMNAYQSGGYTVSGDTLTIGNGAKLTVSGANAGNTYLIAVGNTIEDSGNGWKDGNLIDSSNVLLDFRRVEGDTEKGTVMVTSSAKKAEEVLPCVDIPDNLNALAIGQKIDVDSTTAGIRFLSRATDSRYMPGGRTQMEEVINSASQIATAGAVRNLSYSGSGMFNRAIENHLSRTLQSGDSIRPHEKAHGDLWVDLIGMHQRNHGMPACSGKECGDTTRFGHRIDMAGIIGGIDRRFDENRHAGIALMAGSGSASSKGDFSHTKNDVDFRGASLYGGYDRDNWNVTGNVSYTHFDSDIRQSLPSSLSVGNRLRADVASHLWSAGIRGEYRIRFDNGFDLLPHAGLRYDRLVTSGFRTRADEGTVFSTGRDTQNIYSLPVGAGIRGNLKNRNAWTFTPQADLTAIFAAGDIRDKTEVSAAGLDATDSISTRIVDRTSIMAGIGLDVQKDNKSFGLHYNAMYSSRQMWQGLMAKVVLSFE